MFRRYLLISVVFVGTLFATQSFAYSGLPEAVQAARDFLAQSPPSGAADSDLAAELLRYCNEYPTSSLVPEASWLASQLYQRSEKPQEALAAALRVLTSGATSPFAPKAFEYVWARETNHGEIPVRVADLVCDHLTVLSGNAWAANYLREGLEACRTLNRMNDALSVSRAYVALKNPPSDPAMLLSIGEWALQAADHDLAQTAFHLFAERYTTLPQCIIAWSRLGDLAQAEGKETAALADYSWAWNAYQKNRRDGTFNQPEVAQAAAHALWMLQKPKSKEYEQLTAIDQPLNESRARRMGEELATAYTEVMRADPALAPQAFDAIGTIHRRFGDALLKEGFRRNLAQRGSSVPPYENALPEYARALAAFQQAADRATSSETVKQRAAIQAFEVACGQGDAVFGWACELQKRAPSLNPGDNSTDARLAYFRDTICPLLEKGLNYKVQALALSSTMPIEQYAIHVRESLDLPLRTPLTEMANLLDQQNRTLASSATRFGQSFRHGFQPTSANPLMESVEANMTEAQYNFAAASVIGKLYGQLQPNLDAGSRDFWDDLLANTHYSYASACRVLQEQLLLASAHLSGNTGEENSGLARRINRLLGKGSQEERLALMQWSDFASHSPSKSESGEKMLARLAELDPERFGADKDYPSASRKKR